MYELKMPMDANDGEYDEHTQPSHAALDKIKPCLNCKLGNVVP